jgi:hypothetical protein
MSDTAVKDRTETPTSEKKTQQEKQLLIIGCGPAALIAAHTLEHNGYDNDQFRIIAKDREPSKIGGAQFLHRPLFGEDEPDYSLNIVRVGTSGGYAAKVYGSPAKPTSFDKMGFQASEIEAWSLQKAYDRLWEDYSPGIEVQTVDPENFDALIQCGEYDEIISTIPPSEYCRNPTHEFKSVPIIIGMDPMDEFPFDNLIMYSGRLSDDWYRLSSIGGSQSLEFGSGGEPVINDAMKQAANKSICSAEVIGMKPTGTTCDCGYGHPDTNLLRVGRFGMWDRKVLLHQVPSQVASIL